MSPLAEIMTSTSPRIEFGVERSVCSCGECVRNCLYIPGYLIPADLLRILPGDNSAINWAESHLRASPGALVAAQGRTFRIPTIVPARKGDGSCVFHTAGLCSIHVTAPFGCAFFDNHMDDDEGNRLSSLGLISILDDVRGGYGGLWKHLWERGFTVPGPEESRLRMAYRAG